MAAPEKREGRKEGRNEDEWERASETKKARSKLAIVYALYYVVVHDYYLYGRIHMAMPGVLPHVFHVGIIDNEPLQSTVASTLFSPHHKCIECCWPILNSRCILNEAVLSMRVV